MSRAQAMEKMQRAMPKFRTVDAWIAAATSGLRQASRDRIGDEVLTKFEAARAKEIDEGASDDEAKARALQSLGSAHGAWVRNRRDHFTGGEAYLYLDENIPAHREALVLEYGPQIALILSFAAAGGKLLVFDVTNPYLSFATTISAMLGGAISAFIIALFTVVNGRMFFRRRKHSSPALHAIGLNVAGKILTRFSVIGTLACAVAFIGAWLLPTMRYSFLTMVIDIRISIVGVAILTAVFGLLGLYFVGEHKRLVRLLENGADDQPREGILA